jgi:hypothetical protein
MKKKLRLLAPEPVEPLIRLVRGEKVILDADLARIYGVETKAINRAVKRNADRFPSDFVFQLSRGQAGSLRFQFGTLKSGRGCHRKYLPYAFTEHGSATARRTRRRCSRGTAESAVVLSWLAAAREN